MKELSRDLSVYKKFNFDRTPVGVKFTVSRPEGINEIDKPLGICETLTEADKRGEPFYLSKDTENCVGKQVLGLVEMETFVQSGLVGPRYKIFQDYRANARIYYSLPKLISGTVNYVAISPLDKLTFDPDLLILNTATSQAEIVLRALSYSTGEPWEQKTTSVVSCAWLFVYPYITGKVNYMTTGMAFGSKAKEVFPEGRILISIPYTWIPTITDNLNEMEWDIPSYTDGREGFFKREADIFADAKKEWDSAL